MEAEFKIGNWAILDDAHNDELEEKEGYRVSAFKIDMIKDGLLYVAERDSFRRGFPATNCRPAAEEEIALAKPWPHTLGEAGRREREIAEYQVGGWAILKDVHQERLEKRVGYREGAFEIDKIGHGSLGIEKDGAIEWIPINLLQHATPLEIDTAKEKAAKERLERASAENAVDKPDNLNTEDTEDTEKENDQPTAREIDKMVREITNLRDYQRHAVAEIKRLKNSDWPLERMRLNTEIQELKEELEEAKEETAIRRWNYRVVKRNYKATRDEKAVFGYGIYETHYDNDEQPSDMSMEPDGPEEESIEALRATLEMMMTAFDKPILNYDGSVQATSLRETIRELSIENERLKAEIKELHHREHGEHRESGGIMDDKKLIIGHCTPLGPIDAGGKRLENWIKWHEMAVAKNQELRAEIKRLKEIIKKKNGRLARIEPAVLTKIEECRRDGLCIGCPLATAAHTIILAENEKLKAENKEWAAWQKTLSNDPYSRVFVEVVDERNKLRAEINGAIRPDGIKTQGLKAFAAALKERCEQIEDERDKLRAEIKDHAIWAEGILHDPKARFIAELANERDKYKAALKEVCQTLGPDTECSENMCEGCKAEMGMAYDAALKALDKPLDWPYEEKNDCFQCQRPETTGNFSNH